MTHTLNDRPIPELSEWAEYYYPWCYIAAVRLHHVAKECGEAAPRDILQQEWWLDAAWCAAQQGPVAAAEATA